MDNASKALIFAGGILIAVLVISVSIYVITTARGVASASNEKVEANAVQSYNRFYLSYCEDGNNTDGYNIKGIDALNIYRKAMDDKEREATLHPMNIVDAPTKIKSISADIDNNTGDGTGAEELVQPYLFKYETDVDGYIYNVYISKK